MPYNISPIAIPPTRILVLVPRPENQSICLEIFFDVIKENLSFLETAPKFY